MYTLFFKYDDSKGFQVAILFGVTFFGNLAYTLDPKLRPFSSCKSGIAKKVFLSI